MGKRWGCNQPCDNAVVEKRDKRQILGRKSLDLVTNQI